MRLTQRTLRRSIAAVLVVSAALFAVGSHIERSKAAGEAAAKPADAQRASRTASQPSAGEAAHKGESGSETRSSAERPGHEGTSERHAETHREAKLLGVNPEAVGLVIAAVVASVLLALAIWMRRIAVVLVAIVGFGLVFAAFDVREVLHQADESRTNLIAIASVLIGLHLLAAALAGAALITGRADRRAAAA
jgi:hypothetical protein